MKKNAICWSDSPVLMSSFCAKGTRSNSNSTPKSPRATIRACEISPQVSLIFLISKFIYPLVGGWSTPLKMMDFVSWDDDIPNILGKIKFMFQTTNQIHRNSIELWFDLRKYFNMSVGINEDCELWPVPISNNSSIMWEYDGIWLAAIGGFQASACDFAMMPSMLVSASRAGCPMAFKKKKKL